MTSTERRCFWIRRIKRLFPLIYNIITLLSSVERHGSPRMLLSSGRRNFQINWHYFSHSGD